MDSFIPVLFCVLCFLDKDIKEPEKHPSKNVETPPPCKEPVKTTKENRKNFRIIEKPFWNNRYKVLSETLQSPDNTEEKISLSVSKKFNSWLVYKFNNSSIENIVAIDIGIKTFIAFYNPIKYGCIGDNFKSLYADKPKRFPSVFVKEFLSNTIKFLVEEFDVIILPYFDFIEEDNVKPIVKKVYEAFVKDLVKVSLEKSKKVIRINEDYTSLICSSCGSIKEVKYTKSIFRCKNCKLIVNKDLNAAKNIYMKYLMTCKK